MDGADETTDSDNIDNKNSSDSDGEILDSTEVSDKDEENQEDKGEVENPDGGISDTDSKMSLRKMIPKQDLRTQQRKIPIRY